MVEFNSKIIPSETESDNIKNREWWNNNPMTYDWENNIDSKNIDENFFNMIDTEFASGHSLVNNPNWPKGYVLENFIEYKNFKNKKVLEIGCGAGLVSSHISKVGADLTSIDITDKAIELTKRRFKLFNLNGKILKMDAEKLLFDSNSFDYIISWGVIHHSGNMNKIIAEIYKKLKPNGEAFIMIYNKNSLRYRFYCFFWLGLIKFKLINKSLEQIAGSITDGYIARHLTKQDVLEKFTDFKKINISYSDEVNTISLYLMGPLNRLLSFLPLKFKNKFECYLAKKFGWYLQVKLTK